ncbi:unnamed protein product [Linum tenue]|uniref:Uncharacterized protein n=1 Tax=Linum tenue TaxID=586396 RepID=A0AAV0LVL6_9ROSI|nr:unnamed protein product [Linum tenue]
MQNRRRDCGARDIDIDLQIVGPPVVIAGERLPQQARAVIPDRLLHHPGPLHDPIHDLEPLVPVLVVAVDEFVQQAPRGERIWGREVEDRVVRVLPGDLEVHGDDEGFERFPLRLGPAEGLGDAVVGPAHDVLELGGGPDPVHPGGGEEVVAAGGFLFFGKVVFGAEGEEITRWRGPAVGSGLEVDVAEGSAVD